MSPERMKEFGSAGAYFASLQKIWIVVGSVAYFGAALVDYSWIRWLGIPLYAVSLGLMLMAVQEDDDVHRLTIAGLSFQPAQLGVTSGIVMIAWLMQDLTEAPRVSRKSVYPHRDHRARLGGAFPAGDENGGHGFRSCVDSSSDGLPVWSRGYRFASSASLASCRQEFCPFCIS